MGDREGRQVRGSAAGEAGETAESGEADASADDSDVAGPISTGSPLRLHPVRDDEAGGARASAGHARQPVLTEAHFAALIAASPCGAAASAASAQAMVAGPARPAR
jgi:hypothetical protein